MFSSRLGSGVRAVLSPAATLSGQSRERDGQHAKKDASDQDPSHQLEQNADDPVSPPLTRVKSTPPNAKTQLMELGYASNVLSRLYDLLQKGAFAWRQAQGEEAYRNGTGKKGAQPFRKGSLIDRRAG